MAGREPPGAARTAVGHACVPTQEAARATKMFEKLKIENIDVRIPRMLITDSAVKPIRHSTGS